MGKLLKVAKIMKRIREYRSKNAPVPTMNEVAGIPVAIDNADETDPDNPTNHNTPEDIGPTNDQTISGTGAGPSLGSAPGSL